MKVRRFQAEDFPAVCRVYLDAKRDELRSAAATVAVTPLEDDPAIRGAFETSDVLVLEHEGVIEGFLAFREEHLRALFVHSSMRGMGGGSVLMSSFLGSHNGSLVVYVAVSNVGAIRFYERRGFRRAGAE